MIVKFLILFSYINMLYDLVNLYIAKIIQQQESRSRRRIGLKI